MSDRRRPGGGSIGTVAAGVIAVACASAGCEMPGRSSPFSRDALIRANLTPELDTLAQRPVDIENALTIMSDENLRMFNNDLGRVFYTDRPSRLSPYPIPR